MKSSTNSLRSAVSSLTSAVSQDGKDHLQDSELTPEGVFDLISNERRRMIFAILNELSRGEGLQVHELTEKIAATENDMAIGELNSQDKKRVYVSLYQTHLPQLDESNLLSWDKDTNQITDDEYTEEMLDIIQSVRNRVECS